MPALLLVLICYIGNNATVFISILTVAFGLNGAATVSTTPNFHDIGEDLTKMSLQKLKPFLNPSGPNYAGALYGIVDCIGLTCGFVAPILVAYFTETKVNINAVQ